MHHRPIGTHPHLFGAGRYRLCKGTRPEYQARIEGDTNQHVLVAELDGVAVGYLCATIEREPAHTFKRDTTRLYVHQISVAADRRRRGVGRALFAAVEQIAQDRSINDIALDTWSFNEEAQDFFASLGFSVYKIKLWKRGQRGDEASGRKL